MRSRLGGSPSKSDAQDIISGSRVSKYSVWVQLAIMGYAKLRRSSFCSVVRLELAQPASLLRTVFGMTPLLRSHHPTTFRRIKVEAKEVVEKTVREIVCLCRLYNSESIKSLVSSCWGFESQRVSKVHPNPHHRLAACRTLSPQPKTLNPEPQALNEAGSGPASEWRCKRRLGEESVEWSAKHPGAYQRVSKDL